MSSQLMLAMFPLIDTLKKITGTSYPLVTQAHLDSLKNLVRTEIRKIYRPRTPAEQSQLTEYKTLESLCSTIEITDKNASEDINCLLLNLTPENEDMLSFARDLRARIINDLCENFTAGLAYEENPLSLLSENNPYLNTPTEFAALLLSLLKKNIRADDLICSGLLDHFFMYNSHDVANVSKAYQLLVDALVPDEPCFEQAKNLLDAVAECVACYLDDDHQVLPMRGFEGYSLNGELHTLHTNDIVLKRHLIAPKAFEYTPSDVNFNNLYELLGSQLFMSILQMRVLSKRDAQLMRNKLDSMTDKDVYGLYEKIHSQTSPEYQSVLFMRLSKCISKSKAESLLTTYPDLCWMLLASKPNLFNKNKVTDYIEMTKRTEIKASDIEFVLQLNNNERVFDEQKSERFARVFELVFAKPVLQNGLIIDVIDAMKLDDDIVVRSSEAFNKMRHDLLALVPKQAELVNRDVYTNISDLCYQNQDRIGLLKDLGLQKLNYPRGEYQITSFIIETLFENDALNLADCLDVLCPDFKYANYDEPEKETNHAKCRVLYECFCSTKNPELRSTIVEALQARNWKRSVVFFKVIKKPKIMLEILALLPEQRLHSVFFDELKQRDDKGKTVFDYASSNPSIMTALCDRFNLDSISQHSQALIRDGDDKGMGLYRHSKYYFQAMLRTIPVEQRLEFIKNEQLLILENIEEDLVRQFAINLEKKSAIVSILSACPPEYRLALLVNEQGEIDGEFLNQHGVYFQGIMGILSEPDRLIFTQAAENKSQCLAKDSVAHAYKVYAKELAGLQRLVNQLEQKENHGTNYAAVKNDLCGFKEMMKSAGSEFFNLKLSRESYLKFNQTVINGITVLTQSEVVNTHRVWGSLNLILKGVLSFLSHLTIAPAVVLAFKSKHGYINTFWGNDSTDTRESLTEIKMELEKMMDIIEGEGFQDIKGYR